MSLFDSVKKVGNQIEPYIEKALDFINPFTTPTNLADASISVSDKDGWLEIVRNLAEQNAINSLNMPERFTGELATVYQEAYSQTLERMKTHTQVFDFKTRQRDWLPHAEAKAFNDAQGSEIWASMTFDEKEKSAVDIARVLKQLGRTREGIFDNTNPNGDKIFQAMILKAFDELSNEV